MTEIRGKKAFPLTLQVEGVEIQIHADGTMTGDADLFEAALKVLGISDGPTTVCAWLLLRELRRDEEKNDG